MVVIMMIFGMIMTFGFITLGYLVIKLTNSISDIKTETISKQTIALTHTNDVKEVESVSSVTKYSQLIELLNQLKKDGTIYIDTPTIMKSMFLCCKQVDLEVLSLFQDPKKSGDNSKQVKIDTLIKFFEGDMSAMCTLVKNSA